MISRWNDRRPATDPPQCHDPRRVHVAVVVPVYNEQTQIEATLRDMPDLVQAIIVVDDGSSDATPERIAALIERDPRIQLIRHPTNRGVGAAMVSGYRRALAMQAEIIVKMDGDGQMSPRELPRLLRPLLLGRADYAKGNRFRDLPALRQMPLLRRMGNVALSFLTKAAVGYWNLFDPCNGYVAIRGDVLRHVPLDAVPRTFFFETSMLAELYLMGAVVEDVPMRARYGRERSHLSVRGAIAEFPARLLRCFARRVLLKNFVHDFTLESLFLLTGLPLLLAGVLYGGWNWWFYSQAGLAAPTGTVVIPAMLIILGFQLVLSALGEDLRSVPVRPLCCGDGQVGETAAVPPHGRTRHTGEAADVLTAGDGDGWTTHLHPLVAETGTE